MPEANDQSKREVLERLVAELNRLKPDTSQPQFKEWRASVDASMAELFGPRHRLTQELRNVSFASDFDQGRARALSIMLRAASSVATDAGEIRAANAAGTASAAPAAAAEPAAENVKRKREGVFRRVGRKRSALSAPAPDTPDEVTEPVMPSEAAKPDIPAQMAVPDWPDWFDKPPEPAELSVPEWPEAPVELDTIVEAARVAWPEADAEPAEAAAFAEPAAEAAPAPAAEAEEAIRTKAIAEPEITAETAAAEQADADELAEVVEAVEPAETTEPAADTALATAAEPTETADPFEAATSAAPNEPSVPEWPEWSYETPEPVLEPAPESTLESAERERGTFFHRRSRRRATSETPPVVPDEGIDAVPEETFAVPPEGAEVAVVSEPAPAVGAVESAMAAESAPDSETALFDWPVEPLAFDWLDESAEAQEPVTSAVGTRAADGETAPQHVTETADEPFEDAAVEPAAPKREATFRRRGRKRGTRETDLAATDEPADVSGDDELEGAPAVAPEEPPDAVFGVFADDPVGSDSADAKPLFAVSDEAPGGLEPLPGPVKPAARPKPAAPPESAAPAAEPAAPKRETLPRKSDTAAAANAESAAPKRETIPRGGPDRSETARPSYRKPDTDWRVSSPVYVPPAAEPMSSEARHVTMARPRRRRRRPLVATLAVIVLLAAGVGAWLVWFGGMSTLRGDSATTTTVANPLNSPSANAEIIDAAGDPRETYIVGIVRAGIVQLQPDSVGEVMFLPPKPVTRGEFLVWLGRVREIPVGTSTVPDAFYYDLDASLRQKAIDAYERRIIIDWPEGDKQIAFSPGRSIVVRDAEAWVARMIIGLLPTATVQTELGITAEEALDLRTRISSLSSEELTAVVQGFQLGPEAGWARQQSITRSEVAEFLMKLKAVFDTHLGP